MMFTGIVAGTGRIIELEGDDVIRIVIDFAMVSTAGLEEGASVSVDGAVSYTHLTLPTIYSV